MNMRTSAIWRLTAVLFMGLLLGGCSTESIGTGNANDGLNSQVRGIINEHGY